MATTTFDKEIILSPTAAERLANMLKLPPRILPNLSELERQEEEDWQCYLKNSRKLPPQKRN